MSVNVPVSRPFGSTFLLSYLRVRAMAGIEEVASQTYRRVVNQDERIGVLSVDLRKAEATGMVQASVSGDLSFEGDSLQALVSRLIDAEAPAKGVDALLSEDPLLRHLVDRERGIRIPGTASPHELGVRAILGQQVSVAAARTLASRVAAEWGEESPELSGSFRFAFPTAERLSSAKLENVGLPNSRAEAVRQLSKAVACGNIELSALEADPERMEAELLAIKGIGPWTASYICLRGAGIRDAIPLGDLGLRQAAGGEHPWSERALGDHAERWRPWRGYAAAHLWSTYLTEA